MSSGGIQESLNEEKLRDSENECLRKKVAPKREVGNSAKALIYSVV